MNQKLSPSCHAEAVALFRSEVIGALVRRELDRGDLARQFRYLSRVKFRPPGAKRTRTYSRATLRRWYDAYRKGGLGALMPKPRSDRGHGRALTPEQRDLLCAIRKENPSASAELILRTLVGDGRMEKDAVSPATVRRLFRDRGLERVSLRDADGSGIRRRWQAAHPNALWHGDVCHGPSIGDATHRQPLRIHALMDDASRYIVAMGAYHTERERDMFDLWLGALRRHGKSDAMYLDNGSTYSGNALRLACERLGTTLIHAKPYDAPARGKMERFWRTLRQGCVDFLDPLSSLHDVNVRLYAFVDEHYHRAPHGGLMGRTPLEVWTAYQRERAPDALDEQTLFDALTIRERRRVRKDSTLSLDGTAWELDAGFLAGYNVNVAYSLATPDAAPWVEYDEQTHVLRRVDAVKNSQRPRKAASPKATPSVPFDPPGVLLDRAVGRAPRYRDTDTKKGECK